MVPIGKCAITWLVRCWMSSELPAQASKNSWSTWSGMRFGGGRRGSCRWSIFSMREEDNCAPRCLGLGCWWKGWHWGWQTSRIYPSLRISMFSRHPCWGLGCCMDGLDTSPSLRISSRWTNKATWRCGSTLISPVLNLYGSPSPMQLSLAW